MQGSDQLNGAQMYVKMSGLQEVGAQLAFEMVETIPAK